MENPKPTRITLAPVSPAAGGPLYQQVADGIKREIREGRLLPGAPLPSFRMLAEELMVSLITVKRAYEDLEREGIIYCKQGLGTFVSEEGPARSRQEQQRQARAHLQDALREAWASGASEEEIMDSVRELLKQLKKESSS